MLEMKRYGGFHGRGLGIGEVMIDLAGEGDGCDRCGCPDEELCCPGFWMDRGVPPIWPLSWVFDPKNKLLNDNHGARIFGNFGFPFFDKERKAFMGTALAVTVVSIVVAGFGCFALSSDDSILQLSNWGVFSSRHDSENGNGTKIGEAIYIGLQKVVIMTCTDATDKDYLSWGGCELNGLWWKDVKCGEGEKDFYGYPCEAISECRAAATDSQIGAFVTAVTLLLATIGCLTRIRKVADTNFQKVVGCIPDTVGVLTQIQALYLFASGCYTNFPEHDQDGYLIYLTIGFGYWAYVVCWICAIIRVTMHYLTPVPGGGAGCHCVDFFEAATGIDLDGDGTTGGRLLGRRSWGRGGVHDIDKFMSDQQKTPQFKVEVSFKPHPFLMDQTGAVALADLAHRIRSELLVSAGPLQARPASLERTLADADDTDNALLRWTAASDEVAFNSNIGENETAFFGEPVQAISVCALPPPPLDYSWAFSVSALSTNEHALRQKDDLINYEVESGTPHAISFSVMIPGMTEKLFCGKHDTSTEDTNQQYFSKAILSHFDQRANKATFDGDFERGDLSKASDLLFKIVSVRAVAKPTLLVVYGDIIGFASVQDAKAAAAFGLKFEDSLPVFQRQKASFSSKPSVSHRDPCVHLAIELILEPSARPLSQCTVEGAVINQPTATSIYTEPFASSKVPAFNSMLSKALSPNSSATQFRGPLVSSLDAFGKGVAEGIDGAADAIKGIDFSSMGLSEIHLPKSVPSMLDMPNFSLPNLGMSSLPSIPMPFGFISGGVTKVV